MDRGVDALAAFRRRAASELSARCVRVAEPLPSGGRDWKDDTALPCHGHSSAIAIVYGLQKKKPSQGKPGGLAEMWQSGVVRRVRRCPPGSPWGPSVDRTPR